MRRHLKALSKALRQGLNVDIKSYKAIQELKSYEEDARKFRFLSALDPEMAAKALKWLPTSKAQLQQDLFALAQTGFKQNGFFVEFGATNGVDLSNSWLLEKHFGWSGILAEPARSWHTALKANRTSKVETDCVWRTTGENLTFFDAASGAMSSLDDEGQKATKYSDGNRYQVTTISLLDLLQKYNAPQKIDFLSIDTEGSEFEILNAFDFGKYQFQVICVEHNFAPQRGKIYDLLTRKGYKRVSESLSQFDDWYLLSEA